MDNFVSKFGNLKSEEGLKELNNFLSERSYMDGFESSKADLIIFEALGSPPKHYAHIDRWYRHISSFKTEETNSFLNSASLNKHISQDTFTKSLYSVNQTDSHEVSNFKVGMFCNSVAILPCFILVSSFNKRRNFVACHL